MTRNETRGHWNEVKGKLKRNYGDLIDDDLMYEEGKQKERYGKIQIKLGKTNEEFAKIIEGL